MKLLTARVLFNTDSGGVTRRMARRLEELMSRRGGCSIRYPRSAGALARFAEEAVREGIPLVVAVGGDGTVNQALQPLVGTDTALAVIPTGRGNDIARGLGISPGLEAAWALLTRGELRRIDVGQAGARYFAGVAGVGLDSRVNRMANASRLRWLGWMVYPLFLLRALPHFRPPEFRIRWDGGESRGRMMFAAIGNLPGYGGGMKICPRARPDDGALDACLVHRCPSWRLLQKLVLVYSGRHLDGGYVEYHRSRRFEIEAEGQESLFADGEYFQGLPVDIRSVPQALSVLAPSEGTSRAMRIPSCPGP